MVLIPLFIPVSVYALTVLFEIFDKLSDRFSVKYFLPILLLCFVFRAEAKSTLKEISFNIKSAKKSDMQRLVNIVENNTDDSDSLIVFGNHCQLYLFLDLKIASRYIYQYPPINIDANIFNEFKKDIDNKPDVIIINDRYNVEQGNTFRWNDSVAAFMTKALTDNYRNIYNGYGYSLYKLNTE
jgi:hypothetical protein